MVEPGESTPVVNGEKTTSNLITLSRDLFLNDEDESIKTLGQELFPTELEGKERMVDLEDDLEDCYFYLPIKRLASARPIKREHKMESLISFGLNQLGDKLKRIGIDTIGRLLKTTEGEISKIAKPDELEYLKQRLGYFFKQLLLGPEGVFLWAASLQTGKSGALVIKDEQRRKKYVLKLLENLGQAERDVLEHRYGLQDGRVKTIEEVGKKIGKSRESALKLERSAFNKILPNLTVPAIDRTI